MIEAVLLPMSPGSAGVPVMTVGPVLVIPAPAKIAKSAVVPSGGACARLGEIGPAANKATAADAAVQRGEQRYPVLTAEPESKTAVATPARRERKDTDGIVVMKTPVIMKRHVVRQTLPLRWTKRRDLLQTGTNHY